ncbi:hypothetical protein Pfo_016340 [Paulownia fortunei]|nr:hypothetical protein Pfo_016340 [Paulownia fortunei]
MGSQLLNHLVFRLIIHALDSIERLTIKRTIRSKPKINVNHLRNPLKYDGEESPLHVLARKPNVFKSSSQIGLYESIIYHCIFVDELKKLKYNPGAYQDSYSPRTGINCPQNYRTCLNILRLLWTPIYMSITAGFENYTSHKKQISSPTDEENQQKIEEESQAKHPEEEGKDVGYFPGNYTTCILLFKFAMKVTLTVLGVGFNRIKKIQEKKQRYSHAFQIMNQMIESESSSKDDDEAQNNDEKEKDQIKKDTPLLIAAKMGIPEMVEKILSTCPVAIQDLDSNGKNVLLLAAENRQTSVLDYLVKMKLPEYLFHQVDGQGNSILHLAAMLGELQPWRIPGAALQLQWEIKWYKHVKHSIPPLCFAHNNKNGETPQKIFSKTHKKLVKEGTGWLIKTSESSFATSATVPGGLNQDTGHPVLKDHTAFDVFSISSLVALCLSVTALVFFLAIITSRCEEHDFKSNLPKKLLMGLTSLFGSIAAMLVSFCAGHTFILREKLRLAAVPIYAIACIPVTFFAVAQLPLYFDLLLAACRKVPLRSYKVAYVLDLNQPATEPKEDDSDEVKATHSKREEHELLCRGHILNTLSDHLFDLYASMKFPLEI